MKNNLLNLSFAIILLVAFNSCKKDNPDLDKTLKFSTLSVEEQKQGIEQNGIDFVDNMDEMMNSKAMTALSSFVTASNMEMDYVKPFSQLKKDLAKRSAKSLENFDKQLKVAAGNFDGKWGTYTWNSDIEDFNFTAGAANTATYLFPATENSNSNNGELKITYKESNVVVPDTDSEMYMPASTAVVLKVSGTVAMTANFSATYKSDATPTSAKQTLVIDDYNWSAEMSNNTDKATAKYEFKKGTKILVKMEADLSGNLTINEFEESDGPDEVISKGAFYFQVMDVALFGGIADMKGFSKEMESISASTEQAFLTKQVAVVNKYVKLFGYFVKENKKFADVEFFVSTYEIQPRFVLSDGSKVGIQTYMEETGFGDLFELINEYESDFN